MITPCPVCGSRYLWITVTNKAQQRITLDGPHDGAYSYSISHEDVQDTTYHRATCRACDHTWALDEAYEEDTTHDL